MITTAENAVLLIFGWFVIPGRLLLPTTAALANVTEPRFEHFSEYRLWAVSVCFPSCLIQHVFKNKLFI